MILAKPEFLFILMIFSTRLDSGSCACVNELVDVEGTCLCPPGTFMSDTNMLHCIGAPMNTYVETANHGKSALKMCPYNTYTLSTNSTKQTDCVCNDQTICEICALGKYYKIENVSNTNIQRYVCHACPAGKFAPYHGLSACINCSAGTFASTNGAYDCVPCPANYKNAENGQSSCTECESDTYSTTGSTSCNACHAGTYFNGTNCIPCAHGTFAEVNGMTSCMGCSSAVYH